MRTARTPLVLAQLFLLSACLSAQQPRGGVASPAEHLGRPLAADFELADWSEVSGYFTRLAAESPRVQVEVVGTTTEGRDFQLATISSEANLARLDELCALAARIADPRGITPEERADVLARAKPILMISNAMHSTETAAPQFGMELAYLLATSDEEPWAGAREELVVVMAPCTNPDGLDEVVSWYRETVGTPHEGADLTRLYQLYAGHDNNRDWFMLTQNETRILTEQLYSVWHPQVYWDVHQQGTSRERLFVPPFRDPLNPNLDAGIIAGIGALGGRALLDLTREGFSGVSTGVTYDMWWTGGNRNVPVRHNVIGILTEAASVNLASPVFLPRDDLAAPRGLGDYAPSNRFPAPWPGGWWRLRDIVDYELGFARSLLGSLAREPETWLANAMDAAERAIERGAGEAPRAWLLDARTPDGDALRRLVWVLQLSGIELFRAQADFVADGRSWPAGTIVIPGTQPYGAHVKDLFEVQRYPQGEAPYDVAGWTLPLLLGVRRVELVDPPEVALEPLQPAAGWDAERADDGVTDPGDGRAWLRAFRRLAAGAAVRFVHDPADGEAVGFADEPGEAEEGLVVTAPRIGLYSPWSGVMNEGWARWVLEHWDVPYVTVRNEMVRAGGLGEFLDVLVLPDVAGGFLDEGRGPGTVPSRFARGLDPEGAVAIEEFVRGGGKLIALGRSSEWAIELFRFPLEDVTRGEEAGEFSCPGSVLRAIPAAAPINAGLPDSVALFFSRSAAWKVVEPDAPEGEVAPEDERELEVLLRYAPTRVLLSGWIRAPEVIAGRAAWVRAEHGDGEVHLFGFRPQYRGWAQGTFGLLFRALLLESEG